MAKILLVNPSYRNSYGGSIGSLVNPIFPVLSMASLAAVARKNLHKVEILDLSWSDYKARHIQDKVREFKPDVVGFTVLTPCMNQVRDMSYAIKQISENILCIGGGPHVSALPRESLMESHLDAVVVGEGEVTFEEVINGKNLHSINGLTFKSSENILSTPERDPMSHLDDLPIPAWDLFDLEIYARRTSRLFAKKVPFVAAEFSRGCVYRCDFCASKLTMSFGYRKKSPARCAEEVRYMNSLGIKEFMLTDDIFTTDALWAKSVCHELIKDGNKVAWSCTNGIRVESSNLELFHLMRKAGCYRVAYGFETGNDEVLKKFGKGGKATADRGLQAVRDAKEAKLETMGFFQIGLSSDTRESIRDTISYASKLPLDLMKFGVTIAFPGTKMYTDYRKKNLIRSYNWDYYHIYSGFKVFAHPVLSYDEIQILIKKAYRAATYFNPSFIWNKLRRGILYGEIFRDIGYFFRYVFLSYTQKDEGTVYSYRTDWKAYDFEKENDG